MNKSEIIKKIKTILELTDYEEKESQLLNMLTHVIENKDLSLYKTIIKEINKQNHELMLRLNEEVFDIVYEKINTVEERNEYYSFCLSLVDFYGVYGGNKIYDVEIELLKCSLISFIKTEKLIYYQAFEYYVKRIRLSEIKKEDINYLFSLLDTSKYEHDICFNLLCYHLVEEKYDFDYFPEELKNNPIFRKYYTEFLDSFLKIEKLESKDLVYCDILSFLFGHFLFYAYIPGFCFYAFLIQALTDFLGKRYMIPTLITVGNVVGFINGLAIVIMVLLIIAIFFNNKQKENCKNDKIYAKNYINSHCLKFTEHF